MLKKRGEKEILMNEVSSTDNPFLRQKRTRSKSPRYLSQTFYPAAVHRCSAVYLFMLNLSPFPFYLAHDPRSSTPVSRLSGLCTSGLLCICDTTPGNHVSIALRLGREKRFLLLYCVSLFCNFIAS